MQKIRFYIALPFIYAISSMPFWALYCFSDFVYLILYRIIGYRKKVVRENLLNSFPDKSTKEIRKIEADFFRYFFDLVLETLKTLTISPKNVKKRVVFKDLDIFRKYQERNQSVIIVLGHYGNWELAGARFSIEEIHRLYVIYHPLKNKNYDELMYYMRTRLGNKLYSMNEAFRGMIKNKGELTATAFIADQTPSPKGAHWIPFLNQETPVFVGTAKIAKKLNYPIIYISMSRLKRGYYDLKAELLVENPSESTEEEISILHTRRLEDDIKESPEIWLWSHRRWKHKRSV